MDPSRPPLRYHQRSCTLSSSSRALCVARRKNSSGAPTNGLRAATSTSSTAKPLMAQKHTDYFLNKCQCMTPLQDRLAAMGLDYSDVLNWEGRSKRVRKPPPLTYWDEFVATDQWYLKELTCDIPDDELKAAFEDDVSDAETSDDETYSSDEEEEESDASDSSDEGGDDDSATELADDAAASDDECSDEHSESDATSDSGTDAEADGPTTKRQRRG